MILNPQQILLMRLGQPIIPANDSGGGSSGPTEQKVTQTNVPEYARPYFEDALSQAKAVTSESYTPYQGARVAGMNGAQNEAMRRMSGMRESENIGNAGGVLGMATDGAFDTAGYQSGYIGSTYNPNQVGMFNQPGDINGTFDAGKFSGDSVNEYMSPYMDAVTNSTVREMDRRNAIQGTQRQSQAVGAGAFGGSRAALMDMEANRNHEMQVGDVIAKGRQSAFENAQSQFERDRAARYQESAQDFDADRTNQSLAMNYGLAGLDNARFNETQWMNAAKMGLEGDIANEQARAQAAGIQQKGYGLAGDMANSMVSLGKTEQELAMDRLMGLDALGSKFQANQQQQLDTAYEDFVNQRDYNRNNVAFYSNIIHGLTPQMNSDTMVRSSAPSGTTQMLGLGLGALGAYGMYNK